MVRAPHCSADGPQMPSALTKEMQAARRRIRTSRSSNCSTTNSHRDLPGGEQEEKSQEITIQKMRVCGSGWAWVQSLACPEPLG